VQLLNENVVALHDISHKFQADLIVKCTAATPLAQQNKCQSGDLVLFKIDPKSPLPPKLTPLFLAPYKILKRLRNDVECQHLVSGDIQTFHVTVLTLFYGSESDVFCAAQLDKDLCKINTFLAYKVDVHTRTSMQFLVHFKGDTQHWQPS
jgi:hypothetical protein